MVKKTHSDRQVLLVTGGIEKELLGLLDRWQDVWLSVLVTLRGLVMARPGKGKGQHT